MIELLEWDSAFFGRRIARYTRPRFGPDDQRQLIAASDAQHIDCVYVLADVADTDSIAALQRAGAYFTDVRVTFGTALDAPAPIRHGAAGAVRPASAADIPILTRIAARGHRDTRFYADSHFDPALCNRLYEVWIENSCRGYADAVFVAADDDGIPTGYITCHRDRPPGGHIGLFAVGEEHRGRGLGRALVEAAAAWFRSERMTDMTVATQLRNVRALQFYASVDLEIRHVGVWFHFWPADRAAMRS